MPKPYVLITVVKSGSVRKPIWETYGHSGLGMNDLLLTYSTRPDALMGAHIFNLPVLMSGHETRDEILAKLLRDDS